MILCCFFHPIAINFLVAQLSSTQSDLQEAYRRAEKLEKDVRHHRTMSQNFQKKSDIDRTRVHQFESRLKRETEANASMKQLILRLKKEVQRVMKLHRKAEAELERTCAEEELLKQSVLDEQKTAQVLAQKLQLSAKEVHRLLNENEDLLDRAETKKEPGFDSVPSLLQMDGLAGEISSLPLRPEELAAAPIARWRLCHAVDACPRPHWHAGDPRRPSPLRATARLPRHPDLG